MLPNVCRFELEDDVPVAYCYELQLEAAAQRKGLGKFLMQLLELIVSACTVHVLSEGKALPQQMTCWREHIILCSEVLG